MIATRAVADPLNAVDPAAVPSADDTRTYFHVYRSQSEWATWWERANSRYSPQPLPAVDFASSTIAGVYLGMRPNGCFALSIQQVVERDGAIIVRYHEGKPGPGDTCSAAAVYPLKLIRIQATGLPIQFVEV
ncbi:MAG: protease complex subunit PrcB family protein [Burkholderiales bacterium]|nr:protease complex subunit PrcB family protein [Burkholderiales bacterium]